MVGVIAVIAVIVQLFVAGAASASPADEAAFIDAVNATRASVGLPPLQFDVQLTELARGWTDQMQGGTCGEGNFICHASPISAGVTHPWAKLGENVGTGPDITSVMQAFIASPGHYTNIVDPEFTHIGVGVVWDGPRLFTTHRFMKLQGDEPAPPPPTTTQPPPATAASPQTTTTTTPPQSPATSQPTTAEPEPAPAPVETAPTPIPVPPPTDPERVEVVVRALVRLDRG